MPASKNTGLNRPLEGRMPKTHPRKATTEKRSSSRRPGRPEALRTSSPVDLDNPPGPGASHEEHRRWREELDRDLCRRIAAWAKLWEVCPRAGCRRNDACLRPDGCHAHGDPMSEEEWEVTRKKIREALNADKERRAKAGTDI